MIEALTHKSLEGETPNERLEFLGDAVLDLVLAEMLMEYFPQDDEGRLSKKRAGLVFEGSLAEQAVSLGLGPLLRLGKSEIQSEGQRKPRILAGALEALVGAIFLDGGFSVVRAQIRSWFEEKMSSPEAQFDFRKDFKTLFQEWAQAQGKEAPTYRLLGVLQEPAGFRVVAEIGTEILAEGEGSTKKAAEQEAARISMLRLGVIV